MVSARSGSYVALLRGINVGGKNMLPMKELAKMFEAAGATNVSTYIQSGNVLFTAAPTLAEGLPDVVSADIARRFGFRVPVVVRSAADLDAVVRKAPYEVKDDETKVVAVAFLAHTPDAKLVASLDPKRSPPDEFVVRGREIYLRLPNGARTKLSNAYFDAKLATMSTVRNWRTVLKLRELAGG